MFDYECLLLKNYELILIDYNGHSSNMDINSEIPKVVPASGRVACPECKTVYRLPPNKIKKSVNVKCKKCHNRFNIEPNTAKENKHSKRVDFEKPEKVKDHDIRKLDPEHIRVENEKNTLYGTLFILGSIILTFSVINYWIIVGILILSIFYVKIMQGQLLGQCLKIGENQLPDVYNLCKKAAMKLDMEIPSIFLKMDPYINAYALGVLGKKSIVIHSATISSMNEKELSFIIGHELAHIKCGHTSWGVLCNTANKMNIPIISHMLSYLFKFWSRKCEISADRGGYVACGDFKSSATSLLKAMFGDLDEMDKKIDIGAFLSEDEEHNHNLISILSELLSDYPFLRRRIKAIAEFSKKELIDDSDSRSPQNGFTLLFRDIFLFTLMTSIMYWTIGKIGVSNKFIWIMNYIVAWAFCFAFCKGEIPLGKWYKHGIILNVFLAFILPNILFNYSSLYLSGFFSYGSIIMITFLFLIPSLFLGALLNYKLKIFRSAIFTDKNIKKFKLNSIHPEKL